VPTTVTPDVLGALGIGRTAIIRKPDHGIMGKDIADPAQAAEVKSILEAYRQGRSAPIQEKIDAYLARPEFEAAKGETNARQTQPPAVGDGVQVPNQTGEGKPARRTLTVKRNGVVSPKPDVGQPVVGETQQPTSIVHPITGEKVEFEDVPDFTEPKQETPPEQTLPVSEHYEELRKEIEEQEAAEGQPRKPFSEQYVPPVIKTPEEIEAEKKAAFEAQAAEAGRRPEEAGAGGGQAEPRSGPA
jgi:hypothetical protein